MTSQHLRAEETMELRKQIERAGSERDGAESALASVIASGDVAVRALVETIEHEFASRAPEILGFVEIPDRLAVLDELTRHSRSEVRRAAIRVLGRTGDPRSLSILERSYARDTADHVLEAVGDLGAPGGAALVRKILAQEAGDLTAPDAIDAIRTRALEDFDNSCPMTVVHGAKALAKLADFSLVNILRALARFMVDEEDEIYAFMVRQAAIGALDVSIGPGIATTLEQCYDDPREDDIVWTALDAMLHLGRVRAVDRWIELLSSQRTGVQYSAMSCIERLIGEKPPHVRARAESWWNERRSSFDPALCY